MLSPRFVLAKRTALALAVCLGLVCPALTRADDALTRHPDTGSVQPPTNPTPVAKKGQTQRISDPAEALDARQIDEISDHLVSGLVHCVQGLVLTMAASPWAWKPDDQPPPPPPDSFVSMVPQPPPPPSDVPSGPGGNPVPSSDAPEPGTLVAGLSGIGAFLYRYCRQRRGRRAAEVQPQGEVEPVAEVEMAGV